MIIKALQFAYNIGYQHGKLDQERKDDELLADFVDKELMPFLLQKGVLE